MKGALQSLKAASDRATAEQKQRTTEAYNKSVEQRTIDITRDITAQIDNDFIVIKVSGTEEVFIAAMNAVIDTLGDGYLFYAGYEKNNMRSQRGGPTSVNIRKLAHDMFKENKYPWRVTLVSPLQTFSISGSRKYKTC